ncbi:MAG TPA: hypothetical protein VK668_20075 [Mucilaginibacter sp.]|nr:hypothetical protein [Mucilaginibacter sp.]
MKRWKPLCVISFEWCHVGQEMKQLYKNNITRHIIYLICLLVIGNIQLSHAQSHEYKKLIDSHRPGYTIKRTGTEYTSLCVYLGNTKSADGKVLYHIISKFERIKAAILWHGKSTLLFFNNKERLVTIYYMNMPDDLPYKLEGNQLYFRSRGAKKETMAVSVPDKLPKLLCAFECF